MKRIQHNVLQVVMSIKYYFQGLGWVLKVIGCHPQNILSPPPFALPTASPKPRISVRTAKRCPAPSSEFPAVVEVSHGSSGNVPQSGGPGVSPPENF
jgi:hypothetical protein